MVTYRKALEKLKDGVHDVLDTELPRSGVTRDEEYTLIAATEVLERLIKAEAFNSGITTQPMLWS